MGALVAKSYQELEQLCEPYEVNGKMYVKVRMRNGHEKVVRAYSEAEYRRYNPEVTIIQPAKSRRDVLGFGEAGYIWIFKGDTYSVLDWFKLSPCRYTKLWGWYLPSTEEMPEILPAGITPIKLEWDEVSFDGQLIPDKDITAIVDEKLYDPGTSVWIGKIGERLTLNLICVRAIEIDNMYGTSIFHTFSDEAGNIFTWSTTAKHLEEGHMYYMAGTVKDHTTYKAVKQTVLTRCTIKEDLGIVE